MYKQSPATILTALSVLCAAPNVVAQTRPSDDQVARVIRTSITTTVKHGQLIEHMAVKFPEFRLIVEAGQLAQAESFADVVSVRVLRWSPFNSSHGYWPLESCVVFGMYEYPRLEHNFGVKMRFRLFKEKDFSDLKVEHIAPPSDSTAASVRCELRAHPYLRAPRSARHAVDVVSGHTQD